MELDQFIAEYKKKTSDPYEPQTGEKLITTEQYAEMQGISPAVVRQRIDRGLIAAIKSGRRWYIKIKDDESAGVQLENERLRGEVSMLKYKLSLIQQILVENAQSMPVV